MAKIYPHWSSLWEKNDHTTHNYGDLIFLSNPHFIKFGIFPKMTTRAHHFHSLSSSIFGQSFLPLYFHLDLQYAQTLASYIFSPKIFNLLLVHHQVAFIQPKNSFLWVTQIRSREGEEGRC